VTESEDVADGVQGHSLLQNYLPEFAFEPGCLQFPKLLGKAERKRNLSLCISGSKNLTPICPHSPSTPIYSTQGQPGELPPACILFSCLLHPSIPHHGKLMTCLMSITSASSCTPFPSSVPPVTPPCSAFWGGVRMPCCQMGSEMVLGCSAPSPYLGHIPTSRAIQHLAKELNSGCNLKENSCGRELTVTEEDSHSSLIQLIHLLKKRKEAQEMEKTLAEKDKKLCKKVQKSSIFKKYLEDVVKVSQFEDISEVTSQYKLLVRTQKDFLQSQQGHKQLTEQDKVFLEQYKAEKEADLLQYKNELVQLKLHFDQAQSDIPIWSTNTRLQAEWNVSECNSHRQLNMH
ncbi:hypothetical protein IHE44_0012846, partial [Lamprotornis superbus]